MTIDLSSWLLGWGSCAALFLFCDFALSPLLYIVFGIGDPREI